MTLPAETRISHLTLATSDSTRLARWYTQALGLTVHGQDEHEVQMGGPDGPVFLTLVEQRGAQRQPPFTTGLYHFAILLPSRLALGQSLAHLVQARVSLSGASDHGVSEAVYLNDPDGNGIELTRDRPRAEWQWRDGLVGMTVDPLDLRGLLAEASAEGAPWAGMARGTMLGHAHLRVRDLDETARFYQDVLGFDATARLHGALFVSAGGYHHHFGLNTWESRNAPPLPPDAEGLREVTITLPDRAGLEEAASRLRANNWEFLEEEGQIIVRDPSANVLRIEAITDK